MKFLLVLATLVGFASAGYIQSNNMAGHTSGGYTHTIATPLTYSGGSGGSSHGYSGYGSGNGWNNGGQTHLEQGHSGYLDYSSGGYQQDGWNSKIVKPVVRHGPPVVTKSFFVHQAPEEKEGHVEVVEKEHLVRPRKHYNIVFVKAPAAGGSSVHNNNVNVYPQTEEKTIVYVLTGKKEPVHVNSGDIKIPEPRPPSKPEVVFVKYHNEADAHRAITDIQNKYNNEKDASVSVVGAGHSYGTPSIKQAQIPSGHYGGSQQVLAAPNYHAKPVW